MSVENLGFIHRYVPASEAPAPVLLLLHGTGGDENDLLDLGRALAPGAALLSPRGKVLERGMPRFFRRLAEGVFDLEDLKFRTRELADFVQAASASYGFDLHKVILVGFSNGANIAGSLLLRHPGLLESAILFRPMVPFTPETLPDLAGTSVFIGAGRFDPIVTPQETEQWAKLLESAGAGVTLHWEAGAHGLSAGDVHAAGEWLAR